MSTEFASTLDVREVEPRQRHPKIFSLFNALEVGQSMQLINDHDPRPLYFQFQSLANGQFNWQYLESGPDLWRVEISKTAPAPAVGSSGSCCGHRAFGGGG